MPRRALTLLLLLAAGVAGVSARKLEALRSEQAPGQHLLYLPSGKYLKAVTFGYSNLMADMIYLWSIQYYSNYQVSDRYDYLEQIYRHVIEELDPHYVDPYLVGSMIMSVEAGRHDLALRLLDDGIARNPQEWILAFSAGFLCYNTLHDPQRARDYFQKVVRIPGAPAVAKRFYAEMFNRLGDKATSLRYWSEIYQTADSDYVRQVSWLHVHDLRIDLDLESLQSGVASYRQQRGGLPLRLADLVRARLLSELPLDPDGRDYRYDPRTGSVASESRLLLQAR
jgi:tetratricopeptide (TPR) repeat protein